MGNSPIIHGTGYRLNHDIKLGRIMFYGFHMMKKLISATCPAVEFSRLFGPSFVYHIAYRVNYTMKRYNK